MLRKNKRAKAKEVYTEFYTRILDYKNREEQERREARSQVGREFGQCCSTIFPRLTVFVTYSLDQSTISVTL